MNTTASGDYPLVVVVTPTYNGARYLREAMDSVQAQTWPNLVHLVLDNASTDETSSILAEYADARVPVVVQRNPELLAQCANWSRALQLVPAEATYIRWLCDDDTITPDCVERLARLAETDPEIVVVGSHHEAEAGMQDLMWPVGREVFGGPEAVRMLLMGEGLIVAPQLLWRKSAVDRQKPFFTGEMPTAWDLDAVLDLMMGGKFGFVHACLCRTRVHSNAMTSRDDHRRIRIWTRDALELLRKFGPRVLGPDYPEVLSSFRGYYVRRIMVWRREPGAAEWIGIHREAIQRAGWQWGPKLFAEAGLYWALQTAGLRKAWTGYPGWQ